FLRFIAEAPERTRYVFIDEVQRIPGCGRFIKGLLDLRLPLKFVLTGSSSLDVRSAIGEPMTGRKLVFRVHPLSFREYLGAVGAVLPPAGVDPRSLVPYEEELDYHLEQYATFGGYPAVVLSGDRDKKLRRIEEIYSSYLEKDIAGSLRVENLAAFRKLAVLVAGQQGGLVNRNEVAATLSVSRDTVGRYLDMLENTFVLHSVTPFFSNPRTELSKMPKEYFVDSGLRNFSLGNFSSALHRADCGQVMEGLVAAQLASGLPQGERLHYWRTKSGAEVDFVAGTVDARLACEVKAGGLAAPRVSRGFRSFLEKFKPGSAMVLNSSLWTSAPVGGHEVQFVPLAVFLAGLGG
ncbi:MAG: ATP-binding protein, partial [Deltaproteobacteria bacterium]|nr:ATP-binding protein [Deltaproteobacteria bacterium]